MLDLLDIGQAIARQRRAMALTQGDLATRSGVSRSTINALEAGRLGEIGYRKLASILAVLKLRFEIVARQHRRPTPRDLIEQDDRETREARGPDRGRGGRRSRPACPTPPPPDRI
jgi:transcriptional regulator with XRE-family HTH domain